MEQRRFPIFSERFAELRGDMTQGEFADFLNVSRPTVGFYENGARVPDAIVLRQIAEKCGVSADWLLGLTDVKSSDPDIRTMSEKLHLSEVAIDVILGMTAPDNLGGDPEILYALNAMLEGMASFREVEKDGKVLTLGTPVCPVLLDISDYLSFQPINESEASDFFELVHQIPDGKSVKITNNALKTELIKELVNSLDQLKGKYYKSPEK